MNKAYTESVLGHTAEHFEALAEIALILEARPLTFIERNAVERSMQVLVESCIGLSKHVCKKSGRQVLGDARACTLKALEIMDASHPRTSTIDPAVLQGAIGMRNAIVHDYLNLDWAIVMAVVTKGEHLKLKRFIAAATAFLVAAASE